MKKLTKIFLLALALNFIWENLHSLLYESNMGGPITEPLLFGAAVLDALVIVAISALFMRFSFLKKRGWLIIVLGVIIAVVVEKYALAKGLWAYNAYMPIVPLFQVGLTPAIQLGLSGYLLRPR